MFPRASNTILLVCDIQERFRPLIWRFPTVVHGACTLVRVCGALSVPVLATEQNPARLGATVSELASGLNAAGAQVSPKTRFSMVTPEVRARLGRQGAPFEHVILCGIEGHVCVQQTALELLQEKFRVHLVVDAISSQRPGDRAVALANLVAAGASVTTTEAIAFQLLQDAAHPQFKQVQLAIKEHNEGAKGLEGLDLLA
jgi:nicotinamidase-related amidase